MTDLISRSAVIERLETLRWNYTLKAGYREAMTDAIGEVRSASTLDAVPVVHARWIGEKWCYQCTNCGGSAPEDGGEKSPYCPNCGARMDGESEEET